MSSFAPLKSPLIHRSDNLRFSDLFKQKTLHLDFKPDRNLIFIIIYQKNEGEQINEQ